MTFIYVRDKGDDLSIWTSVLNDDEYRIDPLLPEDIVLDIGMHTGSFCARAYMAGSRRIYGFEVNPDNFRLAQANVGGIAQTYNVAVVRSDERKTDPVYYAGYGIDNTGAGTVFGGEGSVIQTVAFDDIIGDTNVRLVKMDCEGSEWPILMTSQRLAQVQEFVGEWHLNSNAAIEQIHGIKPSLPLLAWQMNQAGFECRFFQRTQDVLPGAIPNPVGNFRFIRRDCLTSTSFARDYEGRAQITEYPCVSAY